MWFLGVFLGGVLKAFLRFFKAFFNIIKTLFKKKGFLPTIMILYKNSLNTQGLRGQV